MDDQTIRRDLEQISKFLFNVSERTPNEETYDSWQRSMKAAIAKFQSSAVPPRCPQCKGTAFVHLHACIHEIESTHLAGSERYQCKDCGHSIYAGEGKPLGLKYTFDA